jgi:plasmid stabilization system protein ParE
MAQVSWAPAALADLEAIAQFIARDSQQYADAFVQRVVAIVEDLPRFPRAGRIVPEYGQETLREVLVGNYRIVYRVLHARIEVAAVVHGARQMPNAPPPPVL